MALEIFAQEEGAGPRAGRQVLVSSQAVVADASPINQQDGTEYTLAPSDNGAILVFTSASAVTLDVPTGLGAGFQCGIVQGGAGQVTPTADGTSISNRQSFTMTAGQNAYIALIAIAADLFVLVGDGA